MGFGDTFLVVRLLWYLGSISTKGLTRDLERSFPDVDYGFRVVFQPFLQRPVTKQGVRPLPLKRIQGRETITIPP